MVWWDLQIDEYDEYDENDKNSPKIICWEKLSSQKEVNDDKLWKMMIVSNNDSSDCIWKDAPV